MLGMDSLLIQQTSQYGANEAMAKYGRYDYSQRVLIPVSLEEQLVPGPL
jgi:hypothetical protein